MPITLNCPSCRKPFRVRDESIGGKVRCPSCGVVLQVPATLSPASAFDELPKGDESAVGVVGLQGTGEGAVNPAASLGPPSIKVPVSTVPVAPPPPAAPPAPSVNPTAGSLPMVPAAHGRGNDDNPWRHVARGLGLIRLGLWFLFFYLVFLSAFALWASFDPNLMINKPGVWKRAGLPLWQEILIAGSSLFVGLAILALLLGRLRCMAAPPMAHARLLAFGSLVFMVIGLIGAATVLGCRLFDLASRLHLPASLERSAALGGAAALLLNDVLTLFMLGQLGWASSRPGVAKEAAGVVVYGTLWTVGTLIGMNHYPVIEQVRESLEVGGTPFGDDQTDTAQRLIIWSVILVGGCFLFLLRYLSVVRSARLAVRQHLVVK